MAVCEGFIAALVFTDIREVTRVDTLVPGEITIPCERLVAALEFADKWAIARVGSLV